MAGEAVGETAQVKVGDAKEAVRQALGPTQNYAKLGEKEFLYYKLGHVVVKDGKVSEVSLISKEAYKEREQAKKQYAAQQAAERKAEREQAIHEAELRQMKAKARVIEADAELAELNADRATYRFNQEVAYDQTVTPPLLGSPIQHYQRTIRAHRIHRSFLKPRVGIPHSFPRFFYRRDCGPSAPHLYSRYH